MNAGTPAPAPATPRAYFPLLDSLRGIAAFGVFVLHIAFPLGLGTGTGVAEYLVEHVSNYPAPSVVIFFGLSGFVLYRPFAARRLDGRPRGTFMEYGVRRAVRILPAYWLSLIVTAIVLNNGYVFSGTGVLRYFLFTQSYSAHTFTLGSPVAWSLDVDVAFYVALPLLVVAMRRLPARTRDEFLRTELAMCAAIYVLCTAYQGLLVHHLQSNPAQLFVLAVSMPASADIVACGMALAVLSVAFEQTPPGSLRRLIGRAPWLPWLAALGAYVLIGQIPGSFTHRHVVVGWLLTKQLRLIIALGSLTPLIFGLERGGLIRGALGSRAARFLGSISYALYLWHWAVIDELIRHHAQQRWGNVAFVIVALVLSVGLASLSWFGLERPSMHAARRWLAARVPIREPPSVLDAPVR